jgi:hypothetical protein
MVDASAYFLSRGWLRIFTKPTPPPAISVSVICDRIALIAHTFKREAGAHMTTCSAKSYCWIRGNFLDSSRKTNWISISVTRMRFEPWFPGRAGIDLTVRPNRNYSGLKWTRKKQREWGALGFYAGPCAEKDPLPHGLDHSRLGRC